MQSNIPLFPESASSMSSHVDYLYFFQVANLLFFAGVVAALVVYFAIRYRREKSPKSEPVHGPMILGIGWGVHPLWLYLVEFVWCAVVYVHFYPHAGNS